MKDVIMHFHNPSSPDRTYIRCGRCGSEIDNNTRAEPPIYTVNRIVLNIQLLLIRISNSFPEQQIARYGDFPRRAQIVCRGGGGVGKINFGSASLRRIHLNYRALHASYFTFHNRSGAEKKMSKRAILHSSFPLCVARQFSPSFSLLT